ncbi:hypothetical protein M885DRAFT_545544 [Pelagophyceae sp. CCMP2097]|nr:hypothetical protein M885DRAFT_545544 [Pelagophyceae sp. CCMP2097]
MDRAARAPALGAPPRGAAAGGAPVATKRLKPRAPEARRVSLLGLSETCAAVLHAVAGLDAPAIRAFGCAARWTHQLCSLGELSAGAARTSPLWKEFASGLRVGDGVDAQDIEGRWFDALVVAEDGDSVTVHYNSWDRRYDSLLAKASNWLAPLRTHSPDWRPGLRRGQMIEAKKGRCWFTAIIVELVPQNPKPAGRPRWKRLEALGVATTRARDALRISSASFEDRAAQRSMHRWRVEDFDSEAIAPLGTHIRPGRGGAETNFVNSVSMPLALLIELMATQ